MELGCSATSHLEAGITPSLEQRNPSLQLSDGRLIDAPPGPPDEFCIEPPVIDTGFSRHQPDQSPMLVS